MRILWTLFLVVFAGATCAQDRDIFARGEHGQLAGSFRDAGATAPLVLIVPGSGPIDRNGQRPPAYSKGVYEKLADELAVRGISTVRIDKRGSYASKGAVRDTDDLHISGYADDARAWVDQVRATQGKDCIWLLGHSEGGLVASVLTARSMDGICGMILVAAPGRSIDLVLHDQLARHTQSKRILKKLDLIVAELKSGRIVPKHDIPFVFRDLFNVVNQIFFIDWMRYEPTEILAKFRGRLLILQGTTDFQVGVADARALAHVQPKAQLEIREGVNHNMSKTDLIFPPSDIALDGDVMDIIARFVKGSD